MPGIYFQSGNRREFLKQAALGLSALSAGGCATVIRKPASHQSLHLALLSDTHIPGDRENGHRGFNPWENLRQIAPEVAGARPEGVILNGDAARLDGQVKDYEELIALLEPIAKTAPIYIGLGNHDDRAHFYQTMKSMPGELARVEGKHVLILEHPLMRIIQLDSLLYVNKVAGLLGKNQREWLTDYLVQTDERPVVLFVHHTLNDGDGDLLDADRLFSILHRHSKVKAVFYGHSHVYEFSERNGIQMINLPAVGYNFRDEDPVGWVEARFYPEGVDLTLHALAGNRLGDRETQSIRWLA